MPILQKPIKGSFVIIHRRDSDFQILHLIGPPPIDKLPLGVSDYSHPEYFTDLKTFNLIKKFVWKVGVIDPIGPSDKVIQ